MATPMSKTLKSMVDFVTTAKVEDVPQSQKFIYRGTTYEVTVRKDGHVVNHSGVPSASVSLRADNEIIGIFVALSDSERAQQNLTDDIIGAVNDDQSYRNNPDQDPIATINYEELI